MSAQKMYTNKLNPLKGWPSPYALDKSLGVVDGQTGIVKGSLIHVDATEKAFKLGLSGNSMPIFAFVGQDEYDALGGGSMNISYYGTNKGIVGLVATGSYELQTTQFVDSDTYAPNTPLTGATGDDLGKVEEGEFYTDTICGIVSDGAVENANGVDVVSFWTYFLPATS